MSSKTPCNILTQSLQMKQLCHALENCSAHINFLQQSFKPILKDWDHFRIH